ncbi:MAG: cytochrome c3 family protein [Proteobacteria bacterium]|nr:cytochrome c3 family protein [Pseudomonadota bacterium]
MPIKVKFRYLQLLLIVFAAFFLVSCASMTGKHQTVACSTCHEGSLWSGASALKKRDNFSNICRECHNYRRPADHHPDRPDSTTWLGIFGESATVEEFIFLYDKKMECLSCHRLHNGSAHLEGTENFLVGGPYLKKRDVCVQCHKNKDHANLNPHVAISASGDVHQRYKCLVCHIKVPEEQSHSRENLSLRASGAFLCLKCHPPMQGEFMSQHFLNSVYDWEDSDSIDMVYLAIDEIDAAGFGMNDDSVLHLDPFGRITCFTCHNPHLPQFGHLKTSSSGLEKIGTGNICVVCHSK